MDMNEENPPTNKLGPGFSEANILSAVSKSGYPLQTIVANNLLSKFDNVQEEWSYIDEDTREHRAIDIYTEKILFDFEKYEEQPRVRPVLSLL